MHEVEVLEKLMSVWFFFQFARETILQYYLLIIYIKKLCSHVRKSHLQIKKLEKKIKKISKKFKN